MTIIASWLDIILAKNFFGKSEGGKVEGSEGGLFLGKGKVGRKSKK